MPDYTHEAQTESGQFLPPNQNNIADARARAAADKAYAKASRPWFKKKRVIIPAALVVALIGIQALGGGNDGGAAAPVAAPIGVASDETSEETKVEPAVKVTADKLISDLEGNALAAATKWEGKRVEITGYLSNIDAQGDYFSVRGADKYTFTNVQVYIKEEHLSTVQKWKEGQKVTATGTVTGVGEVLGYSVDAEKVS